MRHTLLPPPERAALRTEYRIRAIIVLCFMLSFAGIVGVVSLVPGFLRAHTEEKVQVDTLNEIKEGQEQSGINRMQKELSQDATLLDAVAASADPYRASKVAADVISARGAVALTSLSIVRQATSSATVIVQGTAQTRESLLSFKTRLEKMAPGNIVNLPLSDLAKSSNIQFSLQLVQQLQ